MTHVEQEVVCLTCSLAQQVVVVIPDNTETLEQHDGHHIKAMGRVVVEQEPQ